MATLTVDEIKKLLAQTGVELPSARGLKKEDYVKLYEEHFPINESVGAAYSSDDEGTQNGKNSNGDSDWTLITEAVGRLSHDDLFNKMKEQGLSVGPILPNTRKVYEKKYLSYLRNENGFNGNDNTIFMDPSEISDHELEISNPPRKTTPQPSGTSKKTPSRETSIAKEPLPPPRRISYIEEIASGSTRRIKKPIELYESSLLRQRAPISTGEDYVGKWSPKLYEKTVQDTTAKQTSWIKISLYGFFGIGLIALLASLYFGWSPVDPYKSIEQEAEQLTGQQV